MATNSVSPKKGKVVDIPTAPTVGTATAGAESATVAYTAATKGGPATTFTALSNPGSITGTGTSPITVSGLTAGTAYTFTVRGSNATGNGEYSSASNSITALAGTAYESIATSTVGAGGTSTITFSSIPSTYKHLQIRFIGQSSSATSDTSMAVQLNGDTGSNYAGHRIYGDGAGVQTTSATSATFMRADRLNAPTTADSFFGVGVIDFLDYANTNKYKTMRSLGGVERNGSGYIFFDSGLWMNTAAITSITLFSADSGNFRQYSQCALYGIKG